MHLPCCRTCQLPCWKCQRSFVSCWGSFPYWKLHQHCQHQCSAPRQRKSRLTPNHLCGLPDQRGHSALRCHRKVDRSCLICRSECSYRLIRRGSLRFCRCLCWSDCPYPWKSVRQTNQFGIPYWMCLSVMNLLATSLFANLPGMCLSTVRPSRPRTATAPGLTTTSFSLCPPGE